MDRNLPTVSQWQPENREDNLSQSLLTTCQYAEKRIVARIAEEIRSNIQNFDSGLGVEEIIRGELTLLLPKRYSVDAGVVSDRHGKTCGDCDLLIRDPIWSPVVKQGATPQSRNQHFPIEGIYAAAEIKQTLGFDELEKAMEKMVKVSRLDRPDNPYGHITENQHLNGLDQPGMILNPLNTSVFATRLKDGISFDQIAEWFGTINSILDRRHMVTMLCVLGEGTAWYSVETGTPYDADFMRDRNEKLMLQVNTQEMDSTFYRWYMLLNSHLTRSVLNLVHVSASYGSDPPPRKTRSYPKATFNS